MKEQWRPESLMTSLICKRKSKETKLCLKRVIKERHSHLKIKIWKMMRATERLAMHLVMTNLGKIAAQSLIPWMTPVMKNRLRK